MFLAGSLQEYVDKAAAGTPTPGGGSVAALAGALGAAMACMAANFTVGRKKFRDVEPDVRKHLDECMDARAKLLRLIEEDSKAYAFVSEAYGMAKDSAEQKAARDEAVQQALSKAMTPPLDVVRVCRTAIRSVDALAGLANPNLISDVGVAAILLEAALRCAKLNVEVNLSELKDIRRVAACRDEIEAAAAEAAALSRRIVTKAASAIGGSA